MRKVILVLTISAFTSSFVNAAIVSNSIIVDDLEYYIQVNDSVYSLGEDVEMLFRLTNLKSEEWIVNSLFPVWDILISENEGENFDEIWNWSWE